MVLDADPMGEKEVILVIFSIGDLFDELEDLLACSFCIVLRVFVDDYGDHLAEIEV